MAGIELGGTKSVAVVARGATILERHRVPTADPDHTLTALSDRLLTWIDGGLDVAALGIGSFGPVGLDPHRHDYGHVTTTPKPGWPGTDVVGHFAARLNVPIAFDTDTTGAALAEGRWGASRGCHTHVYLTIGTGIGAGIVAEGRPLHGLVHPEVGHVRVRRRSGDPFAGSCPFHADCIEGLAAGPAIAARAGAPAESLPSDHPVLGDVADELGELLAVLVLTISPQRIVLGGGVGYGRRDLLLPVRRATERVLAGYVVGFDAEAVICHPGLGDDAGPLGAVALALLAPEPTS